MKMLEGEKMRERLRMLRMKHGVSMVELAEVIGVQTQQTYYKKETGMLRFNIQEAIKLASFYDMSVEELLCEAEEVSVE